MILTRCWLAKGVNCILHVCGDDPRTMNRTDNRDMYSPRMWRWSPVTMLSNNNFFVFSTYVEMIPHLKNLTDPAQSILHVCGDDPVAGARLDDKIKYSPRMWRWSFKSYVWYSNLFVFSTYVEMILNYIIIKNITSSILHVCGDDPCF